MKFWKHTLIAAATFLGVATTLVYTSCEKDSCLDLKCLNGGTCTDGYCRCPSGYEGPTCNERIVDKFLGTYVGDTKCVSDTTEFPAIIDTVRVFLKDSVTLRLVQSSHITDTFEGISEVEEVDLGVTSHVITIPMDSADNYRRKVTVELSEAKKRLTVYIQETTDVANGIKSDCQFIGFK